jgi:type IV pilus assembly protein PilE
MVLLAIIAMLLTIAVPAYDDFVTRGKLRSGTEGLSAFRGVLEQSYRDNRDFRVDAACGIATYSSDHFALTCVASSRTAYTLTATSLASVGQDTGDYVYTIDQDGVQRTTRFEGETVAIDNWKYK